MNQLSTWHLVLQDHSRSIQILSGNNSRSAALGETPSQQQAARTPPVKIRRIGNDYGRDWQGFWDE